MGEYRFWEVWKNIPEHPAHCLRTWGPPDKPEMQDRGKRYRIERAVPLLRGKTVLDAGAGMGHLFYRIKDNVDDYLGIDKSEGMIQLARNFFPTHAEKFQVGDVCDLSPFGKYDTVFCLAVLVHLPDGYAELAVQQLWEHCNLCVVIGIPVTTERRMKMLPEPKFFIQPSGLIHHYYTQEEVDRMIQPLKGVESVEHIGGDRPEFPDESGSPWEDTYVRINRASL